MNFSFDPDILNTVAGGQSALDMKRLHIFNLESASSFLQAYGFDLNRPRDERMLWTHHRRAIVLLTEQLGYPEENIPIELRDPKLLMDIRLLLLYASRTSAGSTSAGSTSAGSTSADALQRWSCAILRCMHVFVHADNDLFSFFAQEIQEQILIPYEKLITFDGQNVSLRGPSQGEDPIQLVKFETKPFKTTSSSVIKLLARRDALAMRIFDKIGVRFVTKTMFDSFQVIRFLVNENMLSFPHILPDQSSNNLYPVELFLTVCRNLEKENIRDEAEIQKIFERELEAQGNEALFRKFNEQSSRDFRFIKFITRKLIRIIPDGNRPEFGFFYPFEIQILDESCYQQIQSGPSEHQAYKDRQKTAACERLFPGER